MIARKGFDIDLREGEAREDAFVYVLLRARVEHKRDHKCVSTGNVAIEYETSERSMGGGRRWPSGIASTTADFWAIEFDNEAWMLQSTERLKRLARRAITDGRHKWVGDNSRFHNALVPFGWFAEPASPPLEEAA